MRRVNETKQHKVRQDLIPKTLTTSLEVSVVVFQHIADIDRFLPTIHWASDQVLVSENLNFRFR